MKTPIKNIPFFESYDPDHKQLNLRGATYFPEEIFDFANEIEILDMSNGNLSSLPDDFPKLKNLKIAFFSDNPFEEVPEILSKCSNLSMLGFKNCKISRFAENSLPVSIKWLILTHNQLEKLPTSMGKLTELQKLSVTGNKLKSLPKEMTACKNLELIRLGANSFNSPPNWLFELPKLAWYGGGGNPFSQHLQKKPPVMQKISWGEMEFKNIIGESPSSTVFRGVLKKNQQEVAIKVFKQELTSDGFPEDDMKLAIMAGNQQNLIKILGELLPGGSDQKKGLVLEFVPAEYQELGLPPNFETITRDVYPDRSFSLDKILKVLTDVSSAAKHLHGKNIVHGDLYAHNILSNNEGVSLLGDFGAASIYQPSEKKLREGLDVRAFGYLIDDLLDNCLEKNGNEILKMLIKLKTSCLDEDIFKRPLFDKINETLISL